MIHISRSEHLVDELFTSLLILLGKTNTIRIQCNILSFIRYSRLLTVRLTLRIRER